MAQGVWLLEIDVGAVYRFASEAIDVLTSAGDTLVFEEGLADPGVSLDAAAGMGEASVSVSVLSGVDWALLVAHGVPLEGRSAALLRLEAGQVYERARVAVRGRISAVSYGAVHEELGFTVRRALTEYTNVYPPTQATIDATTWPITGGGHVVPDDSEGLMYPLVIGSPGYNASGSAYPAMQVYYGQFLETAAATSYVVVADGAIASTTCRLFVRDEPNDPPLLTTPSNRTITTQTDGLDREVSTITVDSASGNTWQDLRLYVGFDAVGGSGVVDRRNDAVRGAGSVLRWVLEEHVDYPVDYGRLEAVVAYLDAYKIDTFIETPTNLWDWLTGEVLPILPVEMRESIHGIYPFVWRWDATARDAVRHLDATRGQGNVTRASLVTTRADAVYTEVTLEYGPHAGGDAWRFRRVMSATARTGALGASPADDPRVRGSALLGDAQRTYDVVPLVLQCACIWDHTTADLVLRDKVAQHAWARRVVSYEGGSELEALVSGDVVTITDPKLYWDEAVALVWGVQPQGDVTSVELLLLDHPRQTFRAT